MSIEHLRPERNPLVQSRRRQIEHIATQYTKGQHPRNGGVSKNIQLKIVGNTGTSYVVPMPDYERYNKELKYHLRNPQSTEPILHYKNGPVIKMNNWQRQKQKEGRLPGAIYNAGVPPIGSVEPTHRRGRLMGTTFPDADQVMHSYRGY